MIIAAGNLWFVCAIGCNVNVANHTNHKFPAATPMGVPCEVKSTVLRKHFSKCGVTLVNFCCENLTLFACPDFA